MIFDIFAFENIKPMYSVLLVICMVLENVFHGKKFTVYYSLLF